MINKEDNIANIILDSPRRRVSAADLQKRCFSNDKIKDYKDQSSSSDIQPQESELSGVVPFNDLLPVAELPPHVEQTATSNLLKEMQNSAAMQEDKV